MFGRWSAITVLSYVPGYTAKIISMPELKLAVSVLTYVDCFDGSSERFRLHRSAPFIMCSQYHLAMKHGIANSLIPIQSVGATKQRAKHTGDECRQYLSACLP